MKVIARTKYLSLQVTGKDAPELSRGLDFVETLEILQQLSVKQEYALMVATEPLAELSLGWQPPRVSSVRTLAQCQLNLSFQS